MRYPIHSHRHPASQSEWTLEKEFPSHCKAYTNYNKSRQTPTPKTKRYDELEVVSQETMMKQYGGVMDEGNDNDNSNLGQNCALDDGPRQEG